MKKVLILALVAMMLLANVTSLSVSLAESEVIEVPEVENGTIYQFVDDNFQLVIPSDWIIGELTEEQIASDIMFSSFNPEGTRTFTIAYTVFDEEKDTEAVATELAGHYENVGVITINDIEFITYEISELDIMGFVTVGVSGADMYQFVIYPASDEEYSMLALQIVASISVIE